MDAIALFESGENRLCDFTFAVIAPKKMRLERIMVRDGIKKEAALRRIRAQKDESFIKSCGYNNKNYPPYNLDDEVKRYCYGQSYEDRKGQTGNRCRKNTVIVVCLATVIISATFLP